jgi:hypothetical protein
MKNERKKEERRKKERGRKEKNEKTRKQAPEGVFDEERKRTILLSTIREE